MQFPQYFDDALDGCYQYFSARQRITNLSKRLARVCTHGCTHQINGHPHSCVDKEWYPIRCGSLTHDLCKRCRVVNKVVLQRKKAKQRLGNIKRAIYNTGRRIHNDLS